FFSSRRRHTISKRDWSSDVCSSDLAAIGIANGANQARVQVLLSADEVQYFAGVVPHQQPIDCEVPSLDVFLRRLRINHAVGMTRSEERRVGKECRTRLMWDQ